MEYKRHGKPSVSVELVVKATDARGLGLTPGENKPFLQVFLSRHLDPCANVQQLPLVDLKTGALLEHRITLKGRPDNEDIKCAYACVSFQLMCHIKIGDEKSRSFLGYERYEPIGGGAIYLIDMYKPSSNTFTISIRDRSLDDEYEGKEARVILSTKVVKLELDGITLDLGKEAARKARLDNISLMNNIVERFLNTYRHKLKPTVRDAKSMHIPKYVTNISGVKLPASSFIMMPTNEKCTSEHAVNYIIHATSITSSMNGWHEDMIYDSIKRQMDKETGGCTDEFVMTCKIIGEAMCLFSNCCDYVSDLAETLDVERFINIVWTLAGDCEDLGSFPVMVHERLYKSKWTYDRDRYNSLSDRDKKATLLASWARLYIVVDTTAIATLPGQGIGSNEGNVPICHIYSVGIPRVYFCNWLQGETKRKAFIGCSNDQPIKPWEYDCDVPELTFEGTNFSYTTQVPLHLWLKEKQNKRQASDGLLNLIRSRSSMEKKYPSLTKFSILTPQDNTHVKSIYSIPEEKFSGFYRRIVDFWTWNLIHWGINVSDLSVGYGSQREGSQESGYGVDFRDVVSLSDKITLLPTFELSPLELDIIKNTVMQELPFDMDWTLKGLEDTEKKREELLSVLYSENSLFHELESLSTPEDIKQDTKPIPPFISYRLNHVKKLTKSMVESIKEMLNNRDIKSVNVNVHPLTSNLELYLIDIRLYSEK